MKIIKISFAEIDQMDSLLRQLSQLEYQHNSAKLALDRNNLPKINLLKKQIYDLSQKIKNLYGEMANTQQPAQPNQQQVQQQPGAVGVGAKVTG